jgi:hypothetical protein
LAEEEQTMLSWIRWTPVALALALPAPEAAQAAGPFSGMDGEWNGGGLITMSDGKRERLRCRASYNVGQDGDHVQLAIRCASDSYKFDLTGYVTNRGGSLSGQWSETTFNAAGTMSGRASGAQLTVLAVGNTFSARLSMATGSSHQTVTIRPEGTVVDRVTLSLRKR